MLIVLFLFHQIIIVNRTLGKCFIKLLRIQLYLWELNSMRTILTHEPHIPWLTVPFALGPPDCPNPKKQLHRFAEAPNLCSNPREPRRSDPR